LAAILSSHGLFGSTILTLLVEVLDLGEDARDEFGLLHNINHLASLTGR
jgi:hypothetical protein